DFAGGVLSWPRRALASGRIRRLPGGGWRRVLLPPNPRRRRGSARLTASFANPRHRGLGYRSLVACRRANSEGARSAMPVHASKPPLVLIRVDATDEELQRACDILNG